MQYKYPVQTSRVRVSIDDSTDQNGFREMRLLARASLEALFPEQGAKRQGRAKARRN